MSIEEQITATATRRSVDRRIQRTRQMLQQAFKDAVQEKHSAARGNIREIEKSFITTSIQDITERANVNRGTFYLHFTDKYMLMDTVIREQFRQSLTSALPNTLHWEQALEQLILTVLTNVESKYQHQHQPSHILAPLLERAMHEELTALLLTWLTQAPHIPGQERTPPETTARIISWTIFGTALQWSQEEKSLSREQITKAILTIITRGISAPAPEKLSG